MNTIDVYQRVIISPPDYIKTEFYMNYDHLA
jgi:hypothetical protein